MFVIILNLFFFFSHPSLVLQFLQFFLPAPFFDLSIEFCFHFSAFALELLLFVEVELLGEEAAVVAALLQLLHFLFIKHRKLLLSTINPNLPTPPNTSTHNNNRFRQEMGFKREGDCSFVTAAKRYNTDNKS
jgi:hypothetical protein